MGKRDKIIIRGARVNNLKNIDIDIPRDKIVVVTGLSGSGKSSLAFDTIFAEGNRRYMESLSSYARSVLNISGKPDVDKVENLSPTISIDQKSISRSPRSTVGTLTEIYDYLRVLYAKIGVLHCPGCGTEMQKKSNKEILEEVLASHTGSKIAILAPHELQGRNAREIIRSIQQEGYARVRIGGKIMTAVEAAMLVDDNGDGQTEIEAVIDRIKIEETQPDKERIQDSIETGMKAGKGTVIVAEEGRPDKVFNRDFICRECGVQVKEISPRHFSFNSPEGACTDCSGLGVKMRIDPELIIPNKNLTLAEGAIQPWSKSGGKFNGEASYLSTLKAVGDKYGFSVDKPVKNISAQQLSIILYGAKNENVAFSSRSDLGGIKKTIPFEGVIPSLERKYWEAKSEYMQKEIEKYMRVETCLSCQGKRLKKEYLSVWIEGKSIDDLASMYIGELGKFMGTLAAWPIDAGKRKIAEPLLKEITERLKALEDVGLEYLTIGRSAETISGGEAQRIRLAVQIKSELMGMIYVLDEPTVGLHSRDTEKLIKTIQALKEIGNSVVIVEHDDEMMKAADWIVDMGPGAGEEGGEVIFEGDFQQLLQSKTATAQYLSGRKKVFERKIIRTKSKKFIEIIKATENNLKGISVAIPLERFVAIAGVSGSGKSTLVSDILSKALSRHFFNSKEEAGKHKSIKGLNHINKVISINQDPIGKTPRSNAATYTGVFAHIRDIFAGTEEAKSRGYSASQFSFNMRGGRCEVCQGEGMKKIEMHLLPDVYVKCESCGGTRYSQKTLEIEYKGMNIAQILDMSVSYALQFFRKNPLIFEKLKTMEEVGLGYLRLGQSATDLSGGEAQRIKLATELSRKSTGRTLYILDEPTIGLHFEDVRKLLGVLDALVQKGNSVLVVEHNADVISSADWVIELGPEGGSRGGEIIFEGMPDKLKKCKKSWTAKYL